LITNSCTLTLSEILSELRSEDYKFHSAYQSYLDTCFFLFDPRFLSLSFSQFYLTLWIILRRNFNHGISILSETVSPDPVTLPHSRLEYSISALESNRIVCKTAKNCFELQISKENSYKIPYSILLNTIRIIDSNNHSLIRAAFAALFSKTNTSTGLQSVLKIRKSTSCHLASLLKADSACTLINETRKDIKAFYFPSDDSRANAGISIKLKSGARVESKNNASSSPSECRNVPVSSTAVPLSCEKVPDSPLKYSSFNTQNINTSINQLNLGNKEGALRISELIDRFFSNSFKIQEQDLKILEAHFKPTTIIPEELKANLAPIDLSATVLIGEVVRSMRQFSEYDDSQILNSTAEILLTIRAKHFSSRIMNPRAYFLQSLRNSLCAFGNDYPMLSALMKKSQSKAIESARIESIKREEAKEDRVLEAAIAAYETETGKIAFKDSHLDLDFSKFYMQFKEKINSNTYCEELHQESIRSIEQSTTNDDNDLSHVGIEDEDYSRCTVRNVSRHRKSKCNRRETQSIADILDQSEMNIRIYENQKRAKIQRDENAIQNARYQNVLRRLIIGNTISSDEYNMLPPSHQSKCISCGIDREGYPTYKISNSL